MQQLELDLDTLPMINEQIYKAGKEIVTLETLIFELKKKRKVVCKHPQKYIQKSMLGSRNYKAECTLCYADLTKQVFHL